MFGAAGAPFVTSNVTNGAAACASWSALSCSAAAVYRDVAVSRSPPDQARFAATTVRRTLSDGATRRDVWAGAAGVAGVAGAAWLISSPGCDLVEARS